jgi:hypothetical protein
MRLGLAQHDASTDLVSLRREAFVPRGDQARMDSFLGANVGDHFSAAVANVLAGGSEHFEQALYADGLSAQSLAMLRDLVAQHWRSITNDLIPRVEKMIAADDATGIGSSLGAGNRLRIGLFSYQVPVNPPVPAAPVAKTAAKKSARRREGDPT